MREEEQVPFSKLTRADIVTICEWMLGLDQDEILAGGMYRIRVILTNRPMISMRWCELTPEQLAAVLVARLNTARAAFFRIRCAFSMKETDVMDWRELAEAAKGAIETVKPRRPVIGGRGPT